MVRVERSALMAFTPQQLLALVQDVECYPEFLPGCIAATTEVATDESMQAGLKFKLAGLTESFVTENRVSTSAEGSLQLHMRLLKGPFKSLKGQWSFQPLGEAACKVSLAVELDWGTWSLGRLLAPQIERAVGEVMGSFKQRASLLYGN